jgi:putative ABC transport system permease protein
MQRVITMFALLAIFIACLGLYGLASFSIARRTKEIGIRKVLGATTVGIVSLLSKRFIRLVFLAFILALPAIYYYGNNWLMDFAYRVELDWNVFVLSGLTVLGIVFLTVSFQSLRAALANPINALKDE